jgi:hypothetical protein
VPTAEPALGIVSLPPTDSTLGVVGELCELPNVPTTMVTPPADMLTDDVMAAVYAQAPLLHPTLNLAGLPAFLLVRTMPPDAVRTPLALIVMLQLMQVGKTTKVPKSRVWVGALIVVLLGAPCAACGASNNASIGPRQVRKEIEPGHHFFCAQANFDIGSQ